MIKGLFKMNNIINMNFKKIYKLISIITIIYAMNACSSPELNSDIQLLDPSKFETTLEGKPVSYTHLTLPTTSRV